MTDCKSRTKELQMPLNDSLEVYYDLQIHDASQYPVQRYQFENETDDW